jgi:hypothetical protein
METGKRSASGLGEGRSAPGSVGMTGDATFALSLLVPRQSAPAVARVTKTRLSIFYFPCINRSKLMMLDANPTFAVFAVKPWTDQLLKVDFSARSIWLVFRARWQQNAGL